MRLKFRIGSVNHYGIDFFNNWLQNDDTWLFSFWRTLKPVYTKPSTSTFNTERIRKYD